jgi:DNA replication protein DnaC
MKLGALHPEIVRGTCATHGDFETKGWRHGARLIGRICPICLNAAQLECEQINLEVDRKRKESDYAERLARVGIPVAFHDANFNKLDPANERAAAVYDAGWRYVVKFNEVLACRPTMGMIFTGPQGSGKTHLASAMLVDLIRNGYSGMYVTASLMLLGLREASRSFQGESASSQIGRYASPHLLVIDEYGLQSAQDVDYQLLFSVIDARYQRNLPTVLVTNFQRDELKSNLDERVIERIRGPRGLILSFDWQSYRTRQSPPTVFDQ